MTAADALDLPFLQHAQLRDVFNALPFEEEQIESLTFFFAGHGGTKAGTYYLCVSDTDPSRLSTTGFPVTALLSVIAELKPLQANVVIDACQSGAAILDSAALLRHDALGLDAPSSLGIAFLAACGSSEYADESAGGGALSLAVLRYLRGDTLLQTTRPFLDLIDLGRRVSAELQETAKAQIPVSWGINLIGEGRFAPNPHFASNALLEQPSFPPSLSSISAANAKGREVLRRHAFALWSEHRKVEEEPDIATLLQTLRTIAIELGEPSSVVPILRGLATSLRASAGKSKDVFAESLVLYACAVQLLVFGDDGSASQLAGQLLEEAAQSQTQSRKWLLDALSNDRYALLSEGNGPADLFYLPLRLSRILGWLTAGLVIARTFGKPEAEAELEVERIAKQLLQHYSGSLVPMSDAQAPFILVFSEAARVCGWDELREQIIGCYFGGFVESHGIVAQPNITGNDAFRFVLAMGQGSEAVDYSLRANPTQLLTVLLASGSNLGIDAEWDAELANLDHQGGYLFIPSSYLAFGNNTIEEGKNVGFQIGGDIWTLSDFRAFLNAIRPRVEKAIVGLSPTSTVLALVASLLMPDRLPMNVWTWSLVKDVEQATQTGVDVAAVGQQ